MGKEELKELILEEGNVFDNDLPKGTSQIDVFDDFQFKNILNYYIMHFIMLTPTSRIKNATLLVLRFFKSLKHLDYVRMTNILKSVELYSAIVTDGN